MAEDLIARTVPKRVVDLLEAVQVDEQERESASARALCLGEESIEQLEEVAAITKTGEVVRHRVVLVAHW